MTWAFGSAHDSAADKWPFDASDRHLSIAICGTGNGAHALAVVASQHADLDIDWLAGSKERARLLRHGMAKRGLRSTGAVAATAHRIRNISADPAKVIPRADMVLIVAPAFAHGVVLRRIAPYLSEATALGCIPTRGGFEFEATNVDSRGPRERPTIVGIQTLPWSTRVTAPGEAVHVGVVKQEVLLAALPASRAAESARQLSRILRTRVTPIDSFLGMTLGNPGQFIHPGLMYGHFRSWRGQEYDADAIPRLFADATDEMSQLVERLSHEAIAVADRIERASGGSVKLRGAVVSTHNWLRRVYGHATVDTRTVRTCFRTGPIQVRQAPMLERRPGKFVPNFGYRYLTEDVPYGLVVTRALAELADVATPAIDNVIAWAQSVLQKSYLVDDGLQGADVRHLPIPQNHGISTLSDLVDWYSRWELPSGPRALRGSSR